MATYQFNVISLQLKIPESQYYLLMMKFQIRRLWRRNSEKKFPMRES
jgi:hypothetical protein